LTLILAVVEVGRNAAELRPWALKLP